MIVLAVSGSIAAYKIALTQGADVVEIDVTKSKDGQFYVFHPGMEPAFLGIERRLPEMTAEEKNSISHRGAAVRQFARKFARRMGLIEDEDGTC